MAVDGSKGRPTPACAATAPHGAPAQNPSIRPVASASTVSAGGMTEI